MTPYRLHAYLGYTRKALINVIGIAGVLLAQGLVPEPYAHYVTIGIAVVAAAIHYAVPNAAKPGTAIADDAPEEDGDAYVPTGPSDEDLAGVTPLPVTADPAPDADTQRVIAAMVQLLVRAAQAPQPVETRR